MRNNQLGGYSAPSSLNGITEADPAILDAEKPASRYTHTTDERLASTRSKQEVSTHEECAARKLRDPLPGEGVSFRQPMAGQCENDQFPYTTDQYGKQIR